MILIENKCDLVENIEESEGQFKEFYSKNKFMNGFRTSAKTGLNIVESMDCLIKHIIEKLEKIYSSNNVNNRPVLGERKNIILDKKNNNDKQKEKAKCC